MFVNLIVLIIVIVITVFFARLTVRAIKAKRLWVKILGGLGAVSFMGVKGFFGV